MRNMKHLTITSINDEHRHTKITERLCFLTVAGVCYFCWERKKKNFKVSHSLYGRQEHVTWISGGEYKCPVEFVLDFFSVSFFHSSQWFYSFDRFLYGFFFHLSVYSPSIKDIETFKKKAYSHAQCSEISS